MPEISLTTFVDFVIASGTPRITCVRKAKSLYAQEYSSARDFWRGLREAIVGVHRRNQPKTRLDDVLAGLADAKKPTLYPPLLVSYKRWMGRKRFEWIGSSTAPWKRGELSVRVNPELGIGIDDERYVVKLYFKKREPSKQRLDTTLHLMEITLGGPEADLTPGVLDVQRGRLITPTVAIPDIDALLTGEAAAFVAMWNQVSAAESSGMHGALCGTQ